jgi:hypothetical protein
VTGIESLLVGRSFRCERAASDNYHAGETRSSRRATRSRSLESIKGWEYVGLVVVVGLIALAFVGMLQSLGALVEPLPIDATWCRDATGEDERPHAAGRGSACPDAIGSAAPSAPRRDDPTLDVVDDKTTPVDNVRLLSRESRAPPALLAHS